MGIGQRAAVVVATTAILSATTAAPATAAEQQAHRRAPAACENPAEPGQVQEATPWQQNWLSPGRVWPFSNGSGVIVAVIDSGSDADHPQLRGKVKTGFDMLSNSAGGNFDCVSHGTAVASIIAAQRVAGVGFAGLAPGAEILPIRISDREIDANGNAEGGSVSNALFAQAIRRAVDSGASVINLSVALYEDDAAVKAAVEFALRRNVVVVAAAGNLANDGNPTPYPAAYDGVIGVGAIGENGSRWKDSQIGPYVDLVAPGENVVAATRVRGHQIWSGTSFATPMVSAAAALLRSAKPELSAEQVAERLLATADPALGGAEQGYGKGVVDPYRAVTENLNNQPQAKQQGLPPVVVDPAVAARRDWWQLIGTGSLWTAAGLLGLAVVIAAVAALSPLGRRRGWQPARTRAVEAAADRKPDTEDPEDRFFRVPGSPTG